MVLFQVHDTGVMVDWAHSVGLCDSVQEASQAAAALPDTGGLCFVPGFHGLQAPVLDPTATAGFIGISKQNSLSENVQ